MSDLFVKLPDGRLMYTKPNPPKMVPGHFRDKNNPNIFIPDFIQCKHRCLKDVLKWCPRSQSNKTVVTDYCNLFNKTISPEICNECEAQDSDIQVQHTQDSGGGIKGSES